MAASMNTYGTKRATSASGESSVILLAISLANVTASSFVCGLSFQFPEMKGLRASSCVDVVVVANDLVADGAKALELASDAKRVIAEKSFIVLDVCVCVCVCGWGWLVMQSHKKLKKAGETVMRKAREM